VFIFISTRGVTLYPELGGKKVVLDNHNNKVERRLKNDEKNF